MVSKHWDIYTHTKLHTHIDTSHNRMHLKYVPTYLQQKTNLIL